MDREEKEGKKEIKICSCCGQPVDFCKAEYKGVQEDGFGHVILKLFNCPCGSTVSMPVNGGEKL